MDSLRGRARQEQFAKYSKPASLRILTRATFGLGEYEFSYLVVRALLGVIEIIERWRGYTAEH